MNKEQGSKHNAENEEKRDVKPFALYIHFPYCLRRCPYCDFNTYVAKTIPEDEFVTAILKELETRRTEKLWNARAIRTVFFGGGTPSLLSAEQIKKILAAVGAASEVTIEANPSSITKDKMAGFFKAGVNRISFGSQSFSSTILKTLGRDHTPEDITTAVNDAKSVGFKNISLDIIYGVPGQNISMLKSDLDSTIALIPEHISTYNLTIEKGTPFYEMKAKGELVLPEEEEIIGMMDLIESYLPSKGYDRYEISNYSLNGKECLHNLAYWDGDDYLGLGPGAHSYAYPKRWANAALPAEYQSQVLKNGIAESWSEELSKEAQCFEFWFTRLRKISGLDRKLFLQQFGFDPISHYQTTFQELEALGFLSLRDDRILLTQNGLRMYDSVIEKFIK